MTEHLLVLLVCLAVIVVLAALLYAAGRGQVSALTPVYEIRQTLPADPRQHREDRPAHSTTSAAFFYDAHKRISAVTKGV